MAFSLFGTCAEGVHPTVNEMKAAKIRRDNFILKENLHKHLSQSFAITYETASLAVWFMLLPPVGNRAKLNEKIKRVIIHVFKSAGKQHLIRLFDLTSG